MSQLPWLSEALTFPPIDQALTDPDGLLAVGGDLSSERLLLAYKSGIFPWFEQDQPILWWSPDPRAIIEPKKFIASKSLLKRLRKNDYVVKCDSNFSKVITACSMPRSYADGTWINDEMIEAYTELHHLGHAHSIECYINEELVGGLYGVSMGKLFFGESMFHLTTDASKIAFAFLNRLMREHNCPFIDCQLPNTHLQSLGCVTISRHDFKQLLQQSLVGDGEINWQNIPRVLPPWTP